MGTFPGGKKGVFFSIIAVMIVAVFTLAFTRDTAIVQPNRVEVAKSRITLGNDFIQRFETGYLPMALSTSSYWALDSMAKLMNETSFYNSSTFNCSFREALLYGRLYNTSEKDQGSDMWLSIGSYATGDRSIGDERFGDTKALVQTFSSPFSGSNISIMIEIDWIGGGSSEDVTAELWAGTCNPELLIGSAHIPKPQSGGFREIPVNFSSYVLRNTTYYLVLKSPESNRDDRVRVRITQVDDLKDRFFGVEFASPTKNETFNFTGLQNKSGNYQNSFLQWLQLIEQGSANVNRFVLNATRVLPKNVSVYQDNGTGPWAVAINLTVEYSLDASEARWNRTVQVSAKTSIEGIYDPVFSVVRDMKRPVVGTNTTLWNSSAFLDHLRSGTFRQEVLAPSFLQRMHNNLTPSACCGIESLIPNVTQAEAAAKDSKAYVDCDFFVSSGPGCAQGNLYNITGITNSSFPFQLDTYHVVAYSISVNATDQAVY